MLRGPIAAGARALATRASADKPRMMIALQYVFAASTPEELVALRAPHRGAHLAHTQVWAADGRLALGGALGGSGTPGGLLVFNEGVTVQEVEAFARADPYVLRGVVRSHSVRPWTVVIESGVGGAT